MLQVLSLVVHFRDRPGPDSRRPTLLVRHAYVSQSNGASYGLFLAIGQLISAIALQIVNVTDADNWRRAIYSEWVIIGLWLMCLPWVYETPWYYARKGLHENAKAALGKIFRGVKGYEVEHEYRVMQLQLEHEDSTRRSQKDSTFQEIFQGTNLRRTLASFFGVVLLQWSGASVVFSYATCM